MFLYFPTMRAFVTLTILFTFFCGSVSSQELIKDAKAFEKAIEKVVADYPQSFKNIRGEKVMEDEEEIRYASLIELPGINDCLISTSLEAKKKVKWEAMVFTSASFNESVAIYKELHAKLLAADFILVGKTKSKLKGKYVVPELKDSFTSTLYRLNPVNNSYRSCGVELELVNILDEWKVNLRVGAVNE